MRALILAAGIGWRLGGGSRQLPKSLLEFGDKTLLRRHLEVLSACGIGEVAVGVGYRAETIAEELTRFEVDARVELVINPDYEQGNVVTLWTLREALRAGGPVILMDADVLYDARMMQRLVDSAHDNCFLLDRDIEPGDEPVKLCIRDRRPVEFRKLVDADLDYDYHGESVGFFKLSEAAANALAERTEAYVSAGRRDEFYEEALRDLLLDAQGHAFGFEDITGLPWVEIDFPEDVRRAEYEILPRLRRAEPVRMDAEQSMVTPR